jgi:hypothetical protein
MMQRVELTEQEWQRVMAAISYAPWREVNDLMLKIGQQLRDTPDQRRYGATSPRMDGNSKEARSEP